MGPCISHNYQDQFETYLRQMILQLRNIELGTIVARMRGRASAAPTAAPRWTSLATSLAQRFRRFPEPSSQVVVIIVNSASVRIFIYSCVNMYIHIYIHMYMYVCNTCI